MISYFYFQEKITRHQIVGLVLAIAGVLGIVGSPEIPQDGFRPMALLLVAALGYGIAANLVKGIGKDVNPLGMTGWAALMAAPQTAIMATALESTPTVNALTLNISAMSWLVLSSLTSLCAYGIWNHLLQKYQVNQVTPFGLLIPVASLVMAFFILGETTHYLAIGGGAVATTGVWLQSRARL